MIVPSICVCVLVGQQGAPGWGWGGGESGSGWGSGLSDEKNVVWGGVSRGSRRSRTGGAQSDEMKGGEMKS